VQIRVIRVISVQRNQAKPFMNNTGKINPDNLKNLIIIVVQTKNLGSD
jgi:hypothetical protein